MNPFFFHFSCKDALIRDPSGRECADLAAAHRHATQVVDKMITLDDMDWRGWSIKVTDVNDRSVLSVLFPQVSNYPFGTANKRNREAK